MDPVTQGALGAAVALTKARPEQLAGAAVLGALGGMAPDLDVLIRSSADPLLFLEYHRQFTHSLLFIPLGALLCTLVLHGLIGKRFGFRFSLSYVFCFLGYATHGLLDACTTYGTLLFWPLSYERVAWNILSIIDPLVTLPLLAAIVWTVRTRSSAAVLLAVAWFGTYVTFGMVQRDRAEEVAWRLAESRGHTPHRLEAKPSFANLLVFKTVYEADEVFFVDAVHVGWKSKVYVGESVAKLNVSRDLPWLESNSQQAHDVERFRWFSNDYLALDQSDPNRVIDMRYSLLPNDINALWSIQLEPPASAERHVMYQMHRGDSRAALPTLWAMMTGADID
ncbi:Integral membrane protein [Aequoribacter fuscus]|uniref:Integral membrane protein n=1 Tax=Aequoribacter fuscus TaxID=2518989 RepID=F3L182_9GAMM|nr:metal-dependent hydrolase [Aequoribacter fuscus]EGG29908.1 Integral membrane protein [Aequoribacter fuscus]QHJ87811.1 metal-dependent hydrolase [Aequoribacter fuscus]